MKLIYCPVCADIVRLTSRKRSCECRQSWGKYLQDGLEAVIGGSAVPLGFANGSFVQALLRQPESGMGSRFEAFVIARQCPTISRK